MKTSELFASPAELRRLTGQKDGKEQVNFLISQGLNPWVHPETGCPTIYREAIINNQIGGQPEKDGFTMNLDGILNNA